MTLEALCNCRALCISCVYGRCLLMQPNIRSPGDAGGGGKQRASRGGSP